MFTAFVSRANPVSVLKQTSCLQSESLRKTAVKGKLVSPLRGGDPQDRASGWVVSLNVQLSGFYL